MDEQDEQFLGYTISRGIDEDAILSEPTQASPQAAIHVFALHSCSLCAPVGRHSSPRASRDFLPRLPGPPRRRLASTHACPRRRLAYSFRRHQAPRLVDSNVNAKFTFLAFHGNASNIANRAPA